MKFPQNGMTEREIRNRLKILRAYVRLTKTLNDLTFPEKTGKDLGSNMDAILVLVTVFIGDATDRPMTASRVASLVGISRATAYRRLEALINAKIITCVDRNYYISENVMNPDATSQVAKAAAKLFQS